MKKVTMIKLDDCSLFQTVEQANRYLTNRAAKEADAAIKGFERNLSAATLKDVIFDNFKKVEALMETIRELKQVQGTKL